MSRNNMVGVGAVLFVLISAGIGTAETGGWVEFVEETDIRLVADPARGLNDAAENDFAIGDVDQDGDLDIVVMRKREAGNPCDGSSTCQNQLLINEGVQDGHSLNGVFVDRTLEFCTDANDGGQGFLDITNDRDVALVDVDSDGWLDIVTAVAVSEGLPKTISHPRVYINKGSVAGEWQGFIYEEQRIPQLLAIPGGGEISPRFCALAAGDVTGDNQPDLYFGDYDNCASCPEPPPGQDLNDRLLVNLGALSEGSFYDSEHERMADYMLSSGFTTSAVIADMNGDGAPDIVRNPVGSVTIAYNNPNNLGFFNQFESPYNGAGYHVSTGDLNQDGMIDLLVTDDGNDRYLLNTGNGADGLANFLSLPVNGDGGIGGNSVIADLNNDGHNDALIADFDAEFTGCGGRLHIYRNLGDLPEITLDEQGQQPWTPNGTHDVLVFDINGDQWLDMFIGTCSGHQIWINQPPVGIEFSFVAEFPTSVPPESPFDIEVEVTPFGGASVDPATVTLHVSVNDGTFAAIPMAFIDGTMFTAALPASPCGDQLNFHISAELQDNGGLFTAPPNAPDDNYRIVVAAASEPVIDETMEGDVSSWTVSNDGSLEGGAWEQADPNATIVGIALAAPADDATPGAGILAFVTENGLPGGNASDSDVDGGPTVLQSPWIPIDGPAATLSFARWFYSTGGVSDTLIVEISDNGLSWTPLMETGDSASEWKTDEFLISDYLEDSTAFKLRFIASDTGNDSVTEAGIDDLKVDQFLCFLESPIAQGIGGRYVSIDASAGEGLLAIHVAGDSFDADVSCVDQYLQEDGRLGDDPVFQTAAQWGPSITAHGESLIPGHSYSVAYDSGTPGDPQLGPPVTATTSPFGDIDVNGAVNFVDIQFIVQGFQGNFDNATLWQVDLAPCTPNGLVNFEDIQSGVKAFTGVTYAETSCGVPCPPAG